VRSVGRNNIQRPGTHDSGVISNCQFYLTLKHDSPLLVWVTVKRNHRVAIKFEIGKHQVLPKWRANAKAREKFKRLDIRYLIERHGGLS
jgi:hypothetical protein